MPTLSGLLSLKHGVWVHRSEILSSSIYYQAGLFVVERNLFLLLLNCSAWLSVGPAYQDLQTFFHSSGLYMHLKVV